MAHEENAPEKIAQETMESAKDKSQRALSNLRGFGSKAGPYIKNNPYLSLGVAAVTGYVVSRLMTRK